MYFKDVDKLLELSRWGNVELKQIIEKICVSHEDEVVIRLKVMSEQDISLNVPLTIHSA